jgi:hypothetical protein
LEASAEAEPLGGPLNVIRGHAPTEEPVLLGELGLEVLGREAPDRLLGIDDAQKFDVVEAKGDDPIARARSGVAAGSIEARP